MNIRLSGCYVICCVVITLGMSLLVSGCEAQTMPQKLINLAAGKKVLFTPAPNRNVPKGADLGMALTDGEFVSTGADFNKVNPLTVGWQLDSAATMRVNWMVDLGKRCDLDEIAIHFAPFSVPVWGEAFVSDDGVHYKKIAERSRWNDPVFYNGPDSPLRHNTEGWYWRFKNLQNVRGRYVGLRFERGMSTVVDELQVFGHKSAPDAKSSSGQLGDFSMQEPQPFFQKPELTIPTNISAPQPIGISGVMRKGTLVMEFDLPKDLVMDAPLDNMKKTLLSNGDTRYQMTINNPYPTKAITRLYLRAPDSPNNQQGSFQWRYRFGDWQSPDVTTNYRTAKVPATSAPQRLLTAGFGWWAMRDSLTWPDMLASFGHLGINTISLYGTSSSPGWMPSDHDSPEWKLLKNARQQGFKIFGADPTLMPPWRKYPPSSKEGKEMYCQLSDGTISKYICPSYRGKYYQEEIARFAQQVAEVRPDYVDMDMESWPRGYANSGIYEKCTRCQEQFKASGGKDWKEWLENQGREMFIDAVKAARTKLQQSGTDSHFQVSGWSFVPGNLYGLFSFDKLYPKYIQTANPDAYNPYYPSNLLSIANQVRGIRAQLSRSDIWMTLSAGDRGAVTGDAFEWAILESFCNGARGMVFWSQACWDGETVIAYSNAIRAITPVEDIIVDGDLIDDASQVEKPGHLSGMRQGNNMVLLVSDYQRAGNGTLKLTVQLNAPSQVRDLQSGEIIEQQLAKGRQTITLPLNGAEARLLEIKPIT